MILSRFKILVVLQVFLLAGTMALFFFTLQKEQLVVTSINLAILFFIQIFGLIYYLDRINRDLDRFFTTFIYEDSTQNFDLKRSDKSFQSLHIKMNQVIQKLTEIRIGNEKQEYLYLQALHQSATGLCAFYPDGKISLVNEAFYRILDIPKPGSLQQLASLDPGLPAILLAVNPGDREIREITKGNKNLKLSFKARYLKLQNQPLMLVSMDDVKNEMELAEIGAWQKMTRVVTHEIMNSVSPISLMASGLLDLYKEQNFSKLDPEKEELRQKTIDSLEVIRKRSRSLSRFIDNYRTLSRLPSPSLERISVYKLLQSISILFQEELKSKNTLLKLSIDPEHLEMFADEKMLEQALINLIKNALEATNGIEYPEICIAAEKIKSQLNIKISDNGKGIPDEIAGQIFVPFFTTRENGSGIGLSLVKQIMHAHGGQISFESAPGKGSCFFLQFKLHDSIS